MANLFDLIKNNIQVKQVDFCESAAIESEGIHMLDDTSYIVLLPDYLKQKTQLYDDLNSCCENLEYSIKRHKNGTPESRATHYIGPKYAYTDIIQNENHIWPPSLIKLKASLEYDFECPLNSVLINRYQKQQCIPYHKDNEDSLINNPTIFSYSLGETRNLFIKNNENTKHVQFKMSSGTLLIMGGNTNKGWLHSVPKSSLKNTRYNMTFRYIQKANLDTSFKNIILDEMRELQSQTSQNQTELMRIREINQDVRKDVQQLKSYASVANSSLTHRTYAAVTKNNMSPIRTPPSSTSSHSDIAIFDNDTSSDIESCVNLINSHLAENKITKNEIINIKDVRDKNGPLIIKLKHRSTKIAIIKARSETFKVSEALSKHAIELKKRANELLNKKLIKKYWSFNGEIFFSTQNSNDRVKATNSALTKLEATRTETNTSSTDF